MHTCEIYVLFSQNGEVDYVGRTRQGIKRRIAEHKSTLGYKPLYLVVDKCHTDCASIERRWIEYYRASGCKLRNIYFGQGPHYLSAEHRAKLAEAFRGRPVTWGAKISATQKGVKKDWSPEGRERVRSTQFSKGHSRWESLSAEAKERHRLKAREQWDDPERRKRMTPPPEARRWDRLSEEQRRARAAKQSASLRANPNLKAIVARGAAALLAKDPDNMKRKVTKFWEELRKDPVRYREWIDRRAKAIAEAKAKKKALQ